MAETLLSVGLDVGTTSTQLVVSRLTVENSAGSFAVPALVITDRQILYKSDVHFTPLLDDRHIDGQALRQLLEAEYRRADITPEQVDTGAVIITGETSRKENARRVLQALSDLAGEFVVTTAGPDLESILAARGSGAVAHSTITEEIILHMDIGGGTSNLALIQKGRILQTGCLNVGGRLIRMDPRGYLTYVSPVLESLFPRRRGEQPTREELEQLARQLTHALEAAAGLRPADDTFRRLLTREASAWPIPEGPVLLSFSGGVADCIATDHPDPAFGDLGPLLGRTIRASRLCQGNYRLERDAIRATVIGAGCHSTQLSGSTVFCRNVTLPLKNKEILILSPGLLGPGLAYHLEQKLPEYSQPPFLALPRMPDTGYRDICRMARWMAPALGEGAYLCLEQDIAKALGQALAALLPPGTPVLCLDGISPGAGSCLDVGKPVGPALPVVVKTLILER